MFIDEKTAQVDSFSKKMLIFASDMSKKLKNKYKAFCRWQRMPHHVAPMSETETECPTCHTCYVGNFCPRCGQSAKVSRFSIKSALLNFIDVWGMGNRGMYHSLRDLVLRPGYMIRDYLDGMRMAYFPPFKMLFILTTFSLIVNYGFNIKMTTYDEHRQEALIYEDKPADNGKEKNNIGNKTFRLINNFQQNYPNMASLLTVVLMSVFLFPFFRRMKTRTDLRYTEFLVAMIYSANMMTLYEIVIMFFCLPSSLYILVPHGMILLPLKQLSGFSWMKTIFRTVIGTAIMMVSIIIVITIVLIVLEYPDIVEPTK